MRCFPYIKQNSIAEIVSTMESFFVAEVGFFIALPSRIVEMRTKHSFVSFLLALWGIASQKHHTVVFLLAHPRPPPSVVEDKAHPCEREKEKTHRKGVFFLFLCKGYKKDIFGKVLTGFELSRSNTAKPQALSL